MTRRQRIAASLTLCGSVLFGSACAHVANFTPSGTATPTPQATGSGSSPTPAPTGSSSALCTISTRDPNATIVVSIDPDFAVASTAYGSVFGYAVYDPNDGGALPATAAVITATTADLVVFANYDPGLTAHSAAGFPGVSAFPPEPYPFPSSDASPVASIVSNTAWSTGSLASFGNTSATVCYSQTFTFSAAGTYYFGDDPLYNSPSSFRGVVVVSSAP